MAHRSISGEIAAYFPEVSRCVRLLTSLLGNGSYFCSVTAAGSPAIGWTHKRTLTHAHLHASPSGRHCEADSISQNEAESIHQRLIRIYAEKCKTPEWEKTLAPLLLKSMLHKQY